MAAAVSGSSSVPVFEAVKLISGDGFEFIVDRKYAMVSGTIRNILSSPGR